MQLSALADPNPCAVGHDKFGFGVVVGIEGVFLAKGSIFNSEDPILFFFNVPEQLSFRVGDTSYQNPLIALCGLRRDADG